MHAAPAGKRRDQTVNELFGDAIEGKNLRFQQGTFPGLTVQIVNSLGNSGTDRFSTR